MTKTGLPPAILLAGGISRHTETPERLNPLAAAGETARLIQTIKDAIARSESHTEPVHVPSATMPQVAKVARELGYECDWAELLDNDRIEVWGWDENDDEPDTETWTEDWRLILDP